MEIKYIVKFSPESKNDYSYDLNIVTEREKFIVPIRAIGSRAIIEFPDHLDFGTVPVKYKTEKPVMISNLGEKNTKWSLKLPHGFSVTKSEGVLEVGESEQLVFTFLPLESRKYEGKLGLSYDNLEAEVAMRGEAQNAYVYLSKNHIDMRETYITLYSQEYLQIFNKSDVPVEFSWRAFYNEKDEIAQKEKLKEQLDREEAEEKMLLEESPDNYESEDESLDSDDSYDEDEINKKHERAQQKAVSTLKRKYESIRKAVDEDPMLFQDDIFQIEPISGKIWPNTEITVCVTFTPKLPLRYSCTANCDITCSEDRLELELSGLGIGPKAQLSQPDQHYWSVFVNQPQEASIVIENKGDIVCEFELEQQETPFGSKFRVTPDHGILGMGKSQAIKFLFCSDMLGEFHETFHFKLKGADETLPVYFKGRVNPPKFTCNVPYIDFGNCAYNFHREKKITLENVSDIPVEYKIYVPGDIKDTRDYRHQGSPQFTISPCSGTLEKNRDKHEISVDFMPSKEGIHENVLVVDVVNGGPDMSSIPIKAAVHLPKVDILPPDCLDFKEVYLKSPKTEELKLHNTSLYEARFKIKPQEEQSIITNGPIAVSENEGIIKAGDIKTIKVTFTSSKLANVSMFMEIEIMGMDKVKKIEIRAQTKGPRVEIDPKDKLDFGKVDVLKEVTRTLRITNTSSIPAEYTAFTKARQSVWRVVQRHGTLQQNGDKEEIEVVCYADEVMSFHDTLHIVIGSGNDYAIQLHCIGKGTTLYASELQRDIQNPMDFGVRYIYDQNIFREMLIENRGRKKQTIKWEQVFLPGQRKPKKKELPGSNGAASPEKKNELAPIPEDKDAPPESVFKVLPNKFVLDPKKAVPFHFQGYSAVEGVHEEIFKCIPQTEDKRSKGGDIIAYTVKMRAEFITPVLSFSRTEMEFVYTWDPEHEDTPEIITQDLTITCVSQKPTTFIIKQDKLHPFICKRETITLAPQESTDVRVEFDPAIVTDKRTYTYPADIEIIHKLTMKKEPLIKLRGLVQFPNIEVKPSTLDFGCILDDTSKKMYLTIKNTSVMDVQYEWSFIDIQMRNINEPIMKSKKKKTPAKKEKKLKINEIFDILPVSGNLRPSEIETVEFTFNAGIKTEIDATATCKVRGGPQDYEVALIGRSNKINYNISTKQIDFHEIPYNESTHREFHIQNKGKVPFEFVINLSTLSRPGVVEVTPVVSKIMPDGDVKITVKFMPGIVANITEEFYIEIAHFEPERFVICCVSIYPGILLSLNRKNEEEFRQLFPLAQKNLDERNYEAAFSAKELDKGVGKKQPSMGRSMMQTVAFTPDQMEREAEADRIVLCNKILDMLVAVQAKKMQQTLTPVATFQSKALKTQSGFGDDKAKLVEKGGILVGEYCLDFGNLVLNMNKRRTFRLTNVGKSQVTFNFEKKYYAASGHAELTLDPDRVNKLAPGETKTFNVQFTSIKSGSSKAVYGEIKIPVEIDIRGGPKYRIEFKANLTIPELSISTDTVDFGRVLVGQRKIVKVRFENKKEVPCIWRYEQRTDILVAGMKEIPKVTMSPLNGELQPGQKSIVELVFTPTLPGANTQKLFFKVHENTKGVFMITTRANAITYSIQVHPAKPLEPVLPYYDKLIKPFYIENMLDQRIEIYSLDFDKQYKEEEEKINEYEPLKGSSDAVEFLPVRKPGQPFWSIVEEAYQKKLKERERDERLGYIKQEIDNLELKERGIEAETEGGEPIKAPEALTEEEKDSLAKMKEEKEEIEQNKLKEEEIKEVISYPPEVKPSERYHILLIGPPEVGKSILAGYLNDRHQRSIIKMNELREWAQTNNLVLFNKTQDYLNSRKDELEKAKVEYEKAQKKKKKGQDPDPPIDETEYNYLTVELMIELVEARLAHPDCNAGTVFDGFDCEYIKDIQTCMEIIFEGCGNQNIQLLTFDYLKGENDLLVSHNYRYLKRKEAYEKQHKSQYQGKKKGIEELAEETRVGKYKGLKPKDWLEEEFSEYVEYKKSILDYFIKMAMRGEEINKESELKEEREKEIAEAALAGEGIESEGLKPEVMEVPSRKGSRAVPPKEPAKEPPKEPLVEGEEEGEEEKEEIINLRKERYGKRIVADLAIEYDFAFLCGESMKIIPAPEFPDQTKEPLPPPTLQHLLRRVNKRTERAPIYNFKILTPKEVEEGGKEVKEPASRNDSVKEGEGVASQDEEAEKDIEFEENSRWIIKPRAKKILYIKFFATKVGEYKDKLSFEIQGQPTQNTKYDLLMQAECEFPKINDNLRNVFMHHTRGRPTQKGISKQLMTKSGIFQFGPLLIGKDSENKMQESYKKMNSAQMQITNNGLYPLHVDFELKSTALQLEYKSPFHYLPNSMDLEINETKELTIWAFPEEAKSFNEDIVCIVKDNPNPAVFSLACIGAKPIAEVDNEIIEFDRLLLNEVAKKILQIRNVSMIPINWTLDGLEGLPDQFKVGKTSGRLKPKGMVDIEITFCSDKENKFSHNMNLLVEDTEGFEVKQEPKVLTLNAEAFDITVLPTFDNESKILDFEDVRVAESRDKTFSIKNVGLYEVKFGFVMKKRATRDVFTISPMEGDLQPNEEKQIIVRFKSRKEVTIKTTNATTDIKLRIIEAKTGIDFEQVPINCNVSSLYSNYSISPLKNINFGPMMYGENRTRSFVIKNDGHFEFNYIIFDYHDAEARERIKIQRDEELEELGKIEEMKDVVGGKPGEKGKGGKAPPKKEEKKAAPKKEKGGKGKGGVPDDALVMGQYQVVPNSGDISPGQTTTIEVIFTASGAKFYQNTLAIDISNRNPSDCVEGIPYEVVAESCVPGINTEDLDSIFEEQTVISSLDPSLNTQTIVTQSLYAVEENVFWFGTLIASKIPDGAIERFKITNNNKIPCTANISVKPRTTSKSEGFAFEVSPEQVKINPHEHTYVKVSFKPTKMMSYGGIFEALVENGDPKSKSGKLSFELRGEGTLPCLVLEQPSALNEESIPLLKFRKTRLGNSQNLPIVLKNEGGVPATIQFNPVKNDFFHFLSPSTATIMPKSYQSFEVKFEPGEERVEKFVLNSQTMHNPYEQHRIVLQGEGYMENIIFEDLPNQAESQINFGHVIVQKTKKVDFKLANKISTPMKFEWFSMKGEINFVPRIGHINGKTTKIISAYCKSGETLSIENEEMTCKVVEMESTGDFEDWDETMTEVKMVRPSEYKVMMRKKEEAERVRLEEIEAAAAQKDKKKAAPKKDVKKEKGKGKDGKEEEDEIDYSEEASVEVEDTVPEPEHPVIQGSEKELRLECNAIIDYPKYECETDNIMFKPTLMFQTRSYKFDVKNVAMVDIHYLWKITNTLQGTVDNGPFSIIPRTGDISPGCTESFILKFSPLEVESNFERLLVCSILNRSPEQQPLIIEIDGISERPICHFELPPSKYRERKEKDMSPIDNIYNIIEFESLGTKIKNTKRFMVVNPTNQGYEFTWEEEVDETKPKSGMFRCITPKGVILSGKKFEMAFEYTPDAVGNQESFWLFKIPSERLVQHFMVVGMVVEPTILFEMGKINYGPLLVGGRNREVVNLINQEHIPFPFAFERSAIRGNPEYGDSLTVSPMTGVVEPAQVVPIEVSFRPKFEREYNYNLICNVKRKARPLVLNVKGVGYTIHHEVFVENQKYPILSKESHTLDFGDFFINEKKSKTVTICNLGDFNFDFVWKRAASRYVTITPETGTVKKGTKVEFEIMYLPVAEHKLKSYKSTLMVISGPSYDFVFTGSARKPGIQLNFSKFDFGECFVLRQPLPTTEYLEMKNIDDTAISIECLFERKPHLDVQFSPGQVLLPFNQSGDILKIPVIFTPREITKYEEIITFDVNGIYQMDVKIIGEGIHLIIDLARPEEQFIDFGIVGVGGDVTKTATLVNKSRKVVNLSLYPDNKEDFTKNNLTLTPERELSIRSKEQIPIEIRYNPKSRMPAFKHDIMLLVKDNEARRLISLGGVSHGIELKLMEETMDFGDVVKNSRYTRQLQFTNFGDILAKFSWERQSYMKNFTIYPEKGNIPPHEDIFLEITFHPMAVSPMIRISDIKCAIEGVAEPLRLNLVGKCIEQTEGSTKELKLKTIVRQAVKQSVSIQNTSTEQKWNIKPTISTGVDLIKDYFKGAVSIEIPAKGTGQFEITYLPLTMTKQVLKDPEDPTSTIIRYHEASLFFPLPDGRYYI